MASVLIIDDYVSRTENFAKLLGVAGFDVATAYTGTEGVKEATKRGFDVILVHLKLPDAPGTEVVRRLRERGVHARTVILTMFPDLASSYDAARGGADGYVEGLLSPDELVDLVGRAMTGPLPVRRPLRSVPEEGLIMGLELRIREALQIIEAELGSKLLAVELSARVGLSESRLRHLFQSEMAVSLHAYIVERRLARAADHLRSTQEHVRQIAYAVGFEDVRWFRDAFRKRFGMSPRHYRARHGRALRGVPQQDPSVDSRSPVHDKR
jgi:AraC-like DNA-binding protein